MVYCFIFIRYDIIQIQHLLKLNIIIFVRKYELKVIQIQHLLKLNVQLTLLLQMSEKIQIQHLLKLNRNP